MTRRGCRRPPSRGGAALQDQRALDHGPRATPDQGPGLRVRDGRAGVPASVKLSASIRSGAVSISVPSKIKNDRKHGCLLAAEWQWRKKSRFLWWPQRMGKGLVPHSIGRFFALHPRDGRRSPQARRIRPRPRFVQPGMRLGSAPLDRGTPSIARRAVAAGLDIIAVPTSEATRTRAEHLGIKLTALRGDAGTRSHGRWRR